MRIKGTKHETVEITVSSADAWNGVKLKLLESVGVKSYWYTLTRKPGYFFEDEDSRHGSSGDIEVQKATTEQLEVYEAVRKIDMLMRKLSA